jgi:peptidoglycan/xylan/chitin deacetylase (PgdA/CDA1 family)
MYFLFATGALWRCRRKLCARGATVVLTFHRVLTDREFAVTSSLPSIAVRENTFAALMQYLSRSCCPVDVANGPDHDARADARVPIAVTFDDGWKDNAVSAFPLALQYGVPITIFVCPELEGRSFPFWPEAAVAWWRRTRQSGQADCAAAAFDDPAPFVEYLKSLSPAERERVLAEAQSAALLVPHEPTNATLTWEDMLFMSRQGAVFGSHTCTHQILDQLDPHEVRHELTASRQAIETRIGKECRLLAYPNGNCSREIRDQAEAAGYRFAFTTRPGVWTAGCDPLLVPRINMSESKLTGLRGGFSRVAFEYSVFWKAAHAPGPAAGRTTSRTEARATLCRRTTVRRSRESLFLS